MFKIIRSYFSLSFSLFLFGALAFCQNSADSMPKFSVANYNLAWTGPSEGPKGSMPIGNGEVGLNVWVQNNAIHILIARTDAWNEVRAGNSVPFADDMLAKLGKLTLNFDPTDFGPDAGQVLKLEQGTIELKSGTGVKQKWVRIWVDVNSPDIRIESHGAQAFPMTVSFDDKWGYGADHTVLVEKGNVVVYHRNPATSYLWDDGTKLQKINPANYPNPLANRTFGFAMNGPGFVVAGKSLQATSDTAHYLIARTHTEITPTLTAWTTAVQSGLTTSLATNWSTTFSNHLLWWNEFWSRSYINLPTARFEFNQNYVLQRFVNACQGRGNYPAKFNGGLFTPDDGRSWGGGYWMQNTRHIYWPALASGDKDLIQPFLKMYLDLLPIRKEATQSQFGHAGAYFPETIMAWGLWRDRDYNDGVNVDGWMGHSYNGNLEYIAYLLDYVAYTQDTDFLQKKVIPFATELMLWWDLHWPRKNGKLFMTANAAETYWMVTNPSCDVAGLQWVLDHLIALPVNMVPVNVKSAWVKLRSEVPELPTFMDNAQKRLNYFEGADRNPSMQNEENPELYAIFPFRIYGVRKPDLTTGVQSFLNRRYLEPTSNWSQDAIQAAFLGLSDEAWKYTSAYLKSGVDRFPMFFDWVDGFPQWCSGNVGSHALQTMLMQTEGDSILLFPAWKAEWDVCFKLHAPKNTTVEGCLENGKLGALTVIPQVRGKDISTHIAVGSITLSAKPQLDAKRIKLQASQKAKIVMTNQVKILAPKKMVIKNGSVAENGSVEFNLNGKSGNPVSNGK